LSSPALHLLSAGAAKGLVLAMQAPFERASGATLHASFGAVGAMREQLDAGVPCDAIVLTRRLIDALAAAGAVDAASVRDLGWVPTGVAVPRAAPPASVDDVSQLRALLHAARAIYLPDPERATAGIHAMQMLRALGEDGSARVRAFPHGAAAMAAMAQATDAPVVGITQVSEILYTPGVRLLGVLPAPHQLATLYSAAVTRRTAQPALAAALLARLTGEAGREMRARAGFDEAQ
jgi:molybdate transport system substrate-binding protein